MDVDVRLTASESVGTGGEIRIGARGKLYSFLSQCFAHPGEDMLAWWSLDTADDEILNAISELPDGRALAVRVTPLLKKIRQEVRSLTGEQMEADYIRMFACAVPQVLCPPYSSLFTSKDDEKRLAEMQAVKTFYEDCGMVLAEDFRDLPDHASVELELMQYLDFEETSARAAGDDQLAAFFADKGLKFLDRHLKGLMDGMVAVVATIHPSNFYCQIVELAAEIVRFDHQQRLAAIGETLPMQKGDEQ
jgi:TorA maturation chaperone TorD